ncbi:MAG: biotin transporter BioY [Dysosmobacter sp.]|nr:biotin transporter BioY [Dysosmobacter sp.]
MSTAAAVKSKWSAKDMAYVAIMAVVIAICSWISIPTTVPFTLQTFAVFLAVGVLGGRRGTFAVLVFILLGAVGVPVFAGFQGGIGVLLGTTGGYIIGFLLSALLYWAMTQALGEKTPVMVAAMVLGLIVCYAFGTAWFMVVYARNSGAIGLGTALGWCVFPFVIPDLAKIALAVGLTRVLKPHVH